MKKEENLFSTNPEKAAARVAINGVMLASIFVMLAVVFLDLERFNKVAVMQMVLSIPCLFISSLAYSKLGYWKETRLWDIFGYLTNTFGNLFMINAIGLLAAAISIAFSWVYFGITLLLLLFYSLVNIFYTKAFGKKIFKFLFSLAIIVIGGIFPLIFLL